MRRVHPQRAKPPTQSSNNNNKHSSDRVDKTNVSHEGKAWTTHSELHRRYTTDSSNTTLDQAVSHARLSSINNSSATIAPTKKPFMFSSSSMMRHSQEHESDATKPRQSSKLLLTNRSKNKNRSNIEDGGAFGQDRGGVGNRPSIVIGDDDDDDDDFDLPSIDELFTDVLPRKVRRVDNSADNDKTSNSRTYTYQTQTKGRIPLHKHLHSEMGLVKDVAASPTTTEDDQWLMPELQVDQDINLFSPSLSSKNDNQSIQKMPLAMSTRSVVSQTHHALNEIDQFFMDESPTRSPSTRLQTPFGHQESSKQGSSTLHVRTTDVFPPDHDMDEPAADEVILFEDPPPEDQDVTIGSDSQDPGQREAGDKVHDEPRDEPGVGQGETAGNEQATSAVEQSAEESSSCGQTHTFTLPHSSGAFRDRLKKLESVFQSSMDDMMEAIMEVEQLRTSVEKTLTDRQELLNHRGERIHQQARQLQEEASSLHSKTRDNMLHAVHEK